MIELVPISPLDFPKLISWASSADFLLQWTGRTFSFPLDEKQLTEYFVLAEGKNPKRLILKAVDISNKKHIGSITIDWAKSGKDEAALTCIIVGEQEYLGKGIGELIVNEASRIAFDELHLKKLFLNVFDFNSGAIRCYKKCGFTEMYRERIQIAGKEYINIRMELDIKKYSEFRKQLDSQSSA